MKAIPILLFLLPLFTLGQSRSNQATANMKLFQQYYNAGQGDSINAMFGYHWDEAKKFKPIWTKKDAAEMLEKFGKLESFRFIGIDQTDPQKVYVFQTIFSRGGEKTTSMTLDEANALSTFRFITESRGITKLLHKYHQTKGR
ncbi:MAG: hypothetical protein U0V75_08560 [Ferruginibacter sp.]